MKKPKTVIDAEVAMAAKKAAVSEAREALKRLEAEYGDAVLAVRHAQTEADAKLPQCQIVTVRQYNGKVEALSCGVILRRTPSGMLVVRHVGDNEGSEFKFKPGGFYGTFRQAENPSHMGDVRELLDVPAEFLPSAQPA